MGSAEATIRYAPYLEKMHRQLSGVDVVPPTFTLFQALNAVWHKSPYMASFERINPDRGYFGVVAGDSTKNYRLSDFPSLWDMFGKFMGGLDLHLLWGDVYEDVTHGPEIANAITAHSAVLFDEVNTRVLPQFLAGMRDINAVQSSAFMIGKSIIYDGHTKAVNDFAGNLRVASLDLAFRVWNKHLDWSAQVIQSYDTMYKGYFAVKLDNDARQIEYDVKHTLWDVNLFDPARAYIGALNGAAATSGQARPPVWQQVLSGVLAGAALVATGI